MKTLSLLGHEKAEAMLARAITTGKIFPTWIFCGPLGVGKSTLAYKFAKVLLSGVVPKGNSLEIDENDPVHRLVDLRTHPDFFVLEQTDESVSIDDTRLLFSKVRKTPILSKWRVVILENASVLNKNIYNSLLKILEEPPKNTVVILICNNIGALPKTLLSRAAKINLRPISEELVKEFLQRQGVADAEKLSRIAEGSIGYALHLSQNNGLEIYNQILHGFSSEEAGKKALKYIIENNLRNRFEIIKESFLRILKIYVATLNGIPGENSQEESAVFSSLNVHNVEAEIKKVQDIISMLNKCEMYGFDKNAVVASVFEKFFN